MAISATHSYKTSIEKLKLPYINQTTRRRTRNYFLLMDFLVTHDNGLLPQCSKGSLNSVTLLLLEGARNLWCEVWAHGNWRKGSHEYAFF